MQNSGTRPGPMNILHVMASISPRHGGPSKATVDMAKAVAALGHQVRIISTDHDGSERLDVPLGEEVSLAPGVVIEYYPAQFPRFWKTSFPMARRLAHLVPQMDLVHLHSLYLFHDLATGRLCDRHKVPYLLRPHGSLDPFLYHRHRTRKRVMEVLFQNKVTRNAAALHYTTSEEWRLARPFAFDRPGAVVPPGLEPADYRDLPAPGSFRRNWPEIGDRPIILFLGRLSFKKGVERLARALPDLVARGLDPHLVYVGPDEGPGQEAASILAAAGLSDHVTFTGPLSGADKLAAFRDASLFALPSDSENFGIAVVEAMICGLPVVISEHVNLAPDVAAAGAGRITSLDPDDIVNGLAEILTLPEEQRKAMSEAACSLVLQNFTWDRIGPALEQLYDALRAGQAVPEALRPFAGMDMPET